MFQKLTAEDKQIEDKLPPLYLAAGKWDFLVNPSRTTISAEAFQKGGVPTTYFMHGGSHLLEVESLQRMMKFINNTIC